MLHQVRHGDDDDVGDMVTMTGDCDRQRRRSMAVDNFAAGISHIRHQHDCITLCEHSRNAEQTEVQGQAEATRTFQC